MEKPEQTYEELGEVERLKRRNRLLEKMLRQQAGDAAEETAIAQAVREVVPTREPVPPARLKKLGKGVVKVSGILDIGDVHYGELVTARSTSGVAEYSPEIARARFDYTVDEAIRLGQENGVRDILMILGGDMISGDIHDDLSRSNEIMPVEQTLGCAEMVYGGLEKLCQAFEQVNVVSVSGNHARMYRKFFYNRKQIESFDYLMAKFLEAKGADQPNLAFHTPDSFWTTQEVAGRKFLIMHGDTIKQQNSMGLPVYGFMKEGWKFGNLKDTVGDFDDLMIHHFHTPTRLNMHNGNLFVNGALKGMDDYSLAGTRLPAPATQRFLTVGDGRIIADYLIESEHIKS